MGLFQSPECIAHIFFFPQNNKRQAQSTMTHVSLISSTSCIAIQLIMMSVCQARMGDGQRVATAAARGKAWHHQLLSLQYPDRAWKTRLMRVCAENDSPPTGNSNHFKSTQGFQPSIEAAGTDKEGKNASFYWQQQSLQNQARA
jgi:hypothetical protein